MSLIEDASAALAPHTRHLADHLVGTIREQGGRIEEELRELRQQSDLGRPDTGDIFKFFIIRRQVVLGVAGEQIPLNLVSGVPNDDPGPTLGEVWLIESICTNGLPPKSPGFTIRTNTGRLIFAVVPEGMGNESISGSVILLQGETLVMEPSATGLFDFTISVLLRKYPRRQPDAGYGVSEEHYEDQSRTQEHERERDFPGHSYVPESDYQGLTDPIGQLDADLP